MAFFATHPPLPSRVADTAARAGGLQRGSAAPITATRAEFLRRLDGLPVDPRPGDGVVEGERFAHPDLGFELRFPAGWKVANGRQTVAAVAPGRDAMIVLEGAGNGTDPTVALQAFEKQAGIDLSSGAERFEVNGLPAVRAAARARTRDGPLVLEITWVAEGDHIYRIVGATTPSRVATFQPAFREAAASFRRLTAAERGSFREFRLRLVAARGGETLAQLLTRANAATWSTEMVAVANGLEAGTPLRGGELLKVPRAEPYRPR